MFQTKQGGKREMSNFLAAGKNPNKKGFSLVELTVVILIIAVTSGIFYVGIVNYGTKKRTTQAIADLTAVRSALESYYAKNGKYPVSVGYQGCISDWGADFGYGNPWIPELASYFSSGMPIEPRSEMAGDCTDGRKQYFYYSNGHDYKLLNHQPETMSVPANMIDPARTTWAWGFWTEGGKDY